MNKYITILLFSVFSILLANLMSIHPFEVPDENAHYSSLNFLYNEGRMPTAKDKDNLSIEEMETEKIFGIVEGQNKYSYHPDFRVEQISGSIGKYEMVIEALNTPINRTTYSTHQAALYPPLFYWLTLPFYWISSGGSIITRLFFSRLSSVILTAVTILVAYFIGLEIFRKKSYAITIALMTLFFPMTAYIGAGVNSDNLHNLLFTCAALLALKVIKGGWNRDLSLLVGIVIGLDLITKPQAYILFPIFAIATIVRWKWSEWRQILTAIFYVFVPILLIAGWQEIPKFMGGSPYYAHLAQYSGFENFKIFASGYIRTNLTEMPVWYWGVFKWFGVIMPRAWWWIGTRMIGLSALGLLVQFYRDIKSRKISSETRFVFFALGANLIYVIALFWFDWQFYQQFGRSLGLQARYYMPLLVTQMSLILMGLTNLGWNVSSGEWIRRSIIIFFLGLQLTSFYVQLRSYYDFTSLQVFIDQISQYKPFFAKGDWWHLWFPLYFTGIITSTIFALKSKAKK